ncbi:MAG: protein kinase [Gemmataceae bacterium]
MTPNPDATPRPTNLHGENATPPPPKVNEQETLAPASNDHSQRLDAIVVAYHKALEAGQPPDPQSWIDQHPDLADELRAFFAGEQQVARLTTPLRGTTVRYFGDYELLNELARGGMGVVYRANQKSLNRIVALKMILAGQLAGEADVQRFRTEAEAAANLDHPNILPIYEVGEHEGLQYFSMKLVEGGSLAGQMDRLRAHPREAVALLVSIARGVHYAHQRGILHRDLKPANVLLDATGTPYLTDFGLAKQVEADRGLTQTGAIVGTPSYMAPEQARAEKALTTACDVYALGAILFEMVTGQPPFRGRTSLDTILQVIEQEPADPRTLHPHVDRDLAVIALKCLRKEPDQRYASAAELADDLERWLRGEPILARPTGSGERIVKWARRRPAAAALAGVIVLAGLAMLGGGLWFNAQLREQRNEALAKKQEAEEQKELANQRAVAQAKARQEAQAAQQRAEQQLHRSQVMIYAATLSRAQQAIENEQGAVAQRLLGDCQWNLRGWEHRHLLGRVSSKATLSHGNSHVFAAVYSPDGAYLVTASGLGARVFDVRSGEERFTLRGHKSNVISLAFSPDGKRLASGSYDKTVKVWDMATRAEVVSCDCKTNVWSMAFSPDGKQLATGSGEYLPGRLMPPGETQDHQAGITRIWDASTGKQIRSLAEPGQWANVKAVAWSPDGQQLATGTQNSTAQIWDVRTGKVVRKVRHTGGVDCLAWSPDGKQMVTGGNDNNAVVWDADSGRQLFVLAGHRGHVKGAVWSADGLRIATGSYDQTVKVWDATRGGSALLTLSGHTFYVNTVAFSPEGRALASGSSDGNVKVWDMALEQKAQRFLGHPDRINCLAVSPDGKWVASGCSDKKTRIWDATGRLLVRTLEGHTWTVNTVTFSPDGKRLLTGGEDKTLRLWNWETGEELLKMTESRSRIRSAQFSPDGKRFASGGGNTPWLKPELKVWDATTGKVLLDIQVKQDVNSVVFSKDGRTLHGVAGSELKTWDAETGKELRSISGVSGTLALSPDGKHLAARGAGSTCQILDLETGKQRFILDGHNETIFTTCWSPDGSHLATGSHDKTVKLWRMDTGLEVLTLGGFLELVAEVAWSPDGRFLYAGSHDRSLRLWEAGEGHEVRAVKGNFGSFTRAAFSSDSRRVLGLSHNGKVLSWDVITGLNLPAADETFPADAGREAISPDGRLRVGIEGFTLVVEDNSARRKGGHRDREGLTQLANFDPGFHLARLAEIDVRQHPFAARFHLRQLVSHDPANAQWKRRLAEVEKALPASTDKK